jgi:hypothetical protein
MNAEKPTPKIFIAVGILITVLSATAVIFAAVYGPVGAKPHGPMPGTHAASAPTHKRHGHPAPWLIDATVWAVSIANRIVAA